MLEEISNLYQKMLNQWVNQSQPVWFDFLKSEGLQKWLHLFRTYYFESKEKMDEVTESFLENARIASKEDVNDLVDAQRLTIDMLEELTSKVKDLEKKLEQK
jgi:hypothetical protein